MKDLTPLENDLLEALCEMEMHFQGYEYSDEYTIGLFKKVRTAIAKATGGAE